MAPAEDSGCCLWNMLSSLWNWLKRLCFSSPKAESTAEIQQNAQELRQQNIEQNIKKILKNHFSDRFLDEMDQPEWKAGVFINLNGQFFVQYRRLNREGAIPFRDEISSQEGLKEFIKNNLETLTSNSKLAVETYFMKIVDGKNIIINQCSSSERATDPMSETFIADNGCARTKPLTRADTLEYLELGSCPDDLKQFFLNP